MAKGLVIKVSKEKEKQILDDFLSGGDNRTSVLSERYQLSKFKISQIIDNYFNSKKQLQISK